MESIHEYYLRKSIIQKAIAWFLTGICIAIISITGMIAINNKNLHGIREVSYWVPVSICIFLMTVVISLFIASARNKLKSGVRD